MKGTILASVAVAPGKTEVWEFGVPDIPEDGGLLRVETVGVCGTDISNYHNIKEPTILGHHVIGWIERIGKVAQQRWGVREGDRVVMEEYLPCGYCCWCRGGDYRKCIATDPRHGGLRYGAVPVSVPPALYGGFSQYLYLHPRALVHRISEAVPSAAAVFTLPLANGLEWLGNERIVGPGRTVLVLGPGPQGLGCTIASKILGADCVIVAGRQSSAKRLEFARKLGADFIIDVTQEDLGERISQITGGRMVDVIVDATSDTGTTVRDLVKLATNGGTIIIVGYKGHCSDVDFDTVVAKTLCITGVRGHTYKSVETAIGLISSRRLPLECIVSHDYSLHDVDLALKTAGGVGEPDALLVTVSPWKSRR